MLRRIAIFSFIFFIIAPPVLAGKLFLRSNIVEAAPGQQFEVAVVLDTQKETINATEGVLLYPANLLNIVDIRDNRSFIKLWVEKPVFTEVGLVKWSGVTLKGYKGEGSVFSVIFKGKKEGLANISFKDVRAYKDDGKGTAIKMSIEPYVVVIKKDAQIRGLPKEPDNTPPESFTPIRVKDTDLFEGKWSLVFATSDTGVGLSYYEVQEVRPFLFFFGRKPKEDKWVKAESPYELKDQKGKSIIYTKAVDKKGNFRVVSVKKSAK